MQFQCYDKIKPVKLERRIYNDYNYIRHRRMQSIISDKNMNLNKYII